MQASNVSIERNLLSSMMNGSDEYVEWVQEHVKPEYFSIEHHAAIFKGVVASNDATLGRDRSPDMILVQAQSLVLSPGTVLMDEFDDLKIDLEYLEDIRLLLTPVESGKEYAELIETQADRTRMKTASSEIYALASGSDPDFREKSEMIFNDAVSDSDRNLVHEGADLAAAIWNGLTGVTKVRMTQSLTGVVPFDNHTLGLVAGKYYLIAAPTHNGKTQVAKNLVAQAAYNSGAIFVYFPYEEDELTATVSFYSMFTGPFTAWINENEKEISPRIPIHKKRVEELLMWNADPEVIEKRYAMKRQNGIHEEFQVPSPDEMAELRNAYLTVASLDYKIERSPSSISKMRSTIRKIARQNRGRHIVAVLDYVQLAANGDDDYKSIGLISRGVAKSVMDDGNNITWIVMSQFNRGQGTNSLKTDTNYDTVPRDKLPLTALKDCPSLENDPHVIIHMLQNGLFCVPAERESLGLKDLEWVKISISFMKNRITNELEDSEVWIWKKNGLLSHKPLT